MKAFRNIHLNQSKLKELKQQGWMNQLFLGLLTVTEFEHMVEVTETLENHQKVARILQTCRNKNNILQFPLPSAIIEKNRWRLSTGSLQLDALLDGKGLQSGEITLFYGKFRTGKSQIAHQCCVNIFHYFPHSNTNPLAIFVDTEGTFRPERIKQMSQALKLSPENILRRILIIHVNSLSEFNLVIEKMEEILRGNSTKLLIIDSINNFFREELGRDGQVAYKVVHQLISLGEKLHSWAISYNIPILCTGQITAAVSPTYFFDVLPVLGTTLNYFIKQWILLAENEAIAMMDENQGRRFAHLVNGQLRKEAIVQYLISDEGIRDYY